MKLPNDDWRGPIVFVLACGVSLALFAGIVIAELTPGPPSTEELGLFSTLAGAIIGAVAAYLGTHRSDDDDDDKED